MTPCMTDMPNLLELIELFWRLGKAFEVLLKEMQKAYNPAPEKKKAGWFGWGR